ncbi:DUF6232 family protein [Geitlerinema splendidum]|nr:DUF6232 family protein [Geitlerinema splendidum]
MTANNTLPGNQPNIAKASVVQVTKKTVRFGNEVYQFRNVTGFGLTSINDGFVFPVQWILALFVIGLLASSVEAFRPGGVTFILLAIFALLVNNSKPKKYGLELMLNSGDKKLFATTDLNFIKEVVSVLYKFMESDEEGGYVINVQDKSVQFTGNFEGILSTGENSGTQSILPRKPHA